MMRVFPPPVLLVTAMLVLPGCDQVEDDPAVESLSGTAWVLSKFSEADGTTSDPGPANLFVHFVKSDSLYGVSFDNEMTYNTFVLDYQELPGRGISMGEGFVTELGEPSGSRLYEFLARFTKSSSYHATVSELTLAQESGGALMFKGVAPDFLDTQVRVLSEKTGVTATRGAQGT